jgi:GNAT superfamily N-acetyltransferase
VTLRIARASSKHTETLRALHTLTFPLDEHEDYTAGWWWIVWAGVEPIAFAGMRGATSEDHAIYFSRCGVLLPYRGMGIQRQLLARRLSAAKRFSYRACITTTIVSNTPSSNNLIRAGFRLYDPEAAWGGETTLYWRKDFERQA